MPKKTHADIPLGSSFFEYRATYKQPVFDQDFNRRCSGALFHALRNWNVSLQSIYHRQNPTNWAEIGTTFTLFGGRMAFTVGLGSTVFSMKDPSWSEEELVTNVVKAGMPAVLSSGDIALENQSATIAMHVKPISGSIREYVSGLAVPAVPELSGSDVRAYGFSVYRHDSSWVVDASALYPEALFLRIDQFLGPTVSFEEIASKLRNDETRLLDLLNLEVD